MAKLYSQIIAAKSGKTVDKIVWKIDPPFWMVGLADLMLPFAIFRIKFLCGFKASICFRLIPKVFFRIYLKSILIAFIIEGVLLRMISKLLPFDLCSILRAAWCDRSII